MDDNNSKPWTAVYLDTVNQCLVNGHVLNKWELDFLKSIKDRVVGGGDLTSTQYQKLIQIHDKIM